MSGWGKNTAADFSRRFRGLQPGFREKDDLPQPAQTSVTLFQLGPEGMRNTRDIKAPCWFNTQSLLCSRQ